jgi:hypothetical protein
VTVLQAAGWLDLDPGFGLASGVIHMSHYEAQLKERWLLGHGFLIDEFWNERTMSNYTSTFKTLHHIF